MSAYLDNLARSIAFGKADTVEPCCPECESNDVDVSPSPRFDFMCCECGHRFNAEDLDI